MMTMTIVGEKRCVTVCRTYVVAKGPVPTPIQHLVTDGVWTWTASPRSSIARFQVPEYIERQSPTIHLRNAFTYYTLHNTTSHHNHVQCLFVKRTGTGFPALSEVITLIFLNFTQ